MTLAGVAKFVVGVSLAIALMIGGSVLVGLYFMYKVSSYPPKPVFDNEKVNQMAAKAKNSPKPKTTAQPQPSPTPSKQSETVEAKLAPGTYKARVNWSQGLSLRAEPSPNAARIGGLDNNQQVVVLEESADKSWQKVRLVDGEQEGWIKAGNLERQE